MVYGFLVRARARVCVCVFFFFFFFKVACVKGPYDSCGCDLEGFNFPSLCLDCFNNMTLRVIFMFLGVYGLVNVYIVG